MALSVCICQLWLKIGFINLRHSGETHLLLSATLLLTSCLHYDSTTTDLKCSRCRFVVGSGQLTTGSSAPTNGTHPDKHKAKNGANLVCVKVFTHSIVLPSGGGGDNTIPEVPSLQNW